jgi:hypothetical protein
VTNKQSALIRALLLGIITFSLMGLALAFVLVSVFARSSEDNPDFNATAYTTWSSVLPGIIYLFYAYGCAWRFGARDMNLVKFGHVKERPYVGLQSGLLVFAVPAVLLAVAMLFKATYIYELAVFMYYWFYVSVGRTAFFYPLIFLAVPPLTHWGYYNGYRFISIKQKIMYSDPHAKNEHRRNKDKRIR